MYELEEVVLKEKRNNSTATASMILGIIGLVAWFLPILGLPINIIGLLIGILGLKFEKKGKG